MTRYPLQSALDLRRREEDAAVIALANATRSLRIAEIETSRLRQVVDSAQAQLTAARESGGRTSGRGAGASIQLVAKEGDFATLRLPSTEMRRVPIDCRATIGEVGNAEAELISIGKAGRNRWKGVRPQTRGVAMNPVDHPHGGGEGKTSGGRHPVSPWGVPEGRTRDTNKPSQKLIIRRRRTRGARR